MTDSPAPASATSATAKSAHVDTRTEQTAFRRFYARNGRATNSALAFICVWLFFASQNWALFLNPGFYGSYLFSIPPSIILVTALVFVITAGEIDLSFPAVIGAGGGIFMTLLIAGLPVMVAAAVTLLLGPEGGWAEREAATIEEAGWVATSLGSLVLRAETAAMAALTLVQASGSAYRESRE